MPSPNSSSNPADLRGLIAAVTRSTEGAGLNRFLDPTRWKVLVDYVRPAQHKRGELLIAQGDNDRKLYFVESGDLKVDLRTEKGIVHLAILGPGTVVGEGSFFSHAVRVATVSAYSDCKVWTLTPADFDNLSRHHPHVALAMAMALGAVLANRMLDLSKRSAVT
jgi:CRP/FNR family cyclic AMP-dependent transcriptional regulator